MHFHNTVSLNDIPYPLNWSGVSEFHTLNKVCYGMCAKHTLLVGETITNGVLLVWCGAHHNFYSEVSLLLDVVHSTLYIEYC